MSSYGRGGIYSSVPSSSAPWWWARRSRRRWNSSWSWLSSWSDGFSRSTRDVRAPLTPRISSSSLRCLRVAVLGVLDQEHGQERGDGGAGVDHELPAVREMEQGAGQRPEEDDQRGHQERPRRPCHLGARDRPPSLLLERPFRRRRETPGSARAASRSRSRSPGTPRLPARNTPRNRGTGPFEPAARETAATFFQPCGTFGASIPSITTAGVRRAVAAASAALQP